MYVSVPLQESRVAQASGGRSTRGAGIFVVNGDQKPGMPHLIGRFAHAIAEAAKASLDHGVVVFCFSFFLGVRGPRSDRFTGAWGST